MAELQQASPQGNTPSADPHLRNFQGSVSTPGAAKVGDEIKKQTGIEEGYNGLDQALNLLEMEVERLLGRLEPVVKPLQEGNSEQLGETPGQPKAPLAQVLDLFAKRVMTMSGRVSSVNERLDL